MELIRQVLARLKAFVTFLKSRLFPRGAERVALALASFYTLLAQLDRAIEEMQDEVFAAGQEVASARKTYYDTVARVMARERALDEDISRAMNVRRNVAAIVDGAESGR